MGGPPPQGRVAPPFIGLTGAVASGKSEALAALARLGAATLSTDAVTHELIASPQVRDRLVERWGSQVAPGGQVDRTRVGEIVFADRDELRWLESVLHPLVGERVLAWRAGLPPGAAVAVVEVPLLFEAGMEAVFDATVCVVAEDAVRASRGTSRGTGLLEERSGRQLPQEEKAARADYVVRNDDSLAQLEAELARLLPKLTALGGGEA